MSSDNKPSIIVEDTTSGLCNYCQNIVFSRETWQQLWAAQPYQSNAGFICSRPYLEIQASTARGCWTCTNILQKVLAAIPKADTKTPWKFMYSLTSPVVGQPRKVNMLSVKVVIPGKPWARTTTVEFSIYATPGTSEADRIMSPELDEDGVPVPLPNGVKRWFNDCRDHHPSCASLRQVKLPSRLLDTLPFEDEGDVVRLHVTQHGEVGEYAALSYCWGTVKDRFVVTAATLQAATTKIEWNTLHKTYQDAVKVCRKLGVRYLWIDAVCILQDKDNIDMGIELPRMHQYYKNAAVVISAADSEHANAGFLLDSSTSTTSNNHKLPAWSPSGTAINLTASTSHNVYQPERQPIETRAWTLQERLLGTRILHVLSNGSILMVCDQETTHNELVVFETFYPPRGAIHRMYQGDTPFYDSLLPDMAPAVSEHHHIFGSWVALVSTYGTRNLTVSSDKLVAFASLAEEYSLQHEDLLGEYYAGIWSKKLLACLCWKTQQQTVKGTPYRAPSWSWASADTAHYTLGDEAESHPDFPVLDVEVHVQPQIPGFRFGPVVSASLKLRGRCRWARWRAHIKGSGQHKVVLVDIGENESCLAEVDRTDDLPTRDGEEVLLLALGERPDSKSSVTPGKLSIICLVLKFVTGSVYKRVGFASECHVLQTDVVKWHFLPLEIH